MTQTLRPPVALGDYEGGAGLDGSSGKATTLAARLMALAESASSIGALATADLPETLEEWEALDFTAMPDAGLWAFDTTLNAPRFWDGTAWRGATGALATASVAHFFTIGPVAAKGTNNVHALYDDVTGAFPGPFTNPDVPRNLRIVFSASWDGGDITVNGTDQFDTVISEVFADVAGTTVVGTKIFKTVTGATKETAAGVAGNGASIGTGDKIGVPADIDAADTTALLLVGVTPEAVTIDATRDAFTPTTTPAATTFKLLVNIVTS